MDAWLSFDVGRSMFDVRRSSRRMHLTPGENFISDKLFLSWMDGGRVKKKMNIEHRTSNIEHRVVEWLKGKDEKTDL